MPSENCGTNAKSRQSEKPPSTEKPHPIEQPPNWRTTH